MKNIIIILIFMAIAISICETIAQSSIKQYNNTKKINYMVIAILFYSIICFLLSYAFNLRQVAIINLLWSGVSIVLITFVDYFILKEKFNRIEIFGMMFTFIGIILILSVE